ncbi:MAG: PilZ domain-containing protein [Thermodesulfobacteriota bacterium]|nr:PilZ domain-containing protein [Thermodesulfobacteriota bacterium]
MTIGAESPKEERRSPRIDFRLEVTIRGRHGLETVKNFSLYGVFVHTENPSQFEVGDEVQLTMKFPSEKKPLELKARVIHISEKGIGVEFLDLPPKDAMTIEYSFNVFKHTVPLPGN